MSFRTRLTLFFVLIVIVPMIAVGVVRLPPDRRTTRPPRSRRGSPRARPPRSGLYDEARKNALRALRRVGCRHGVRGSAVRDADRPRRRGARSRRSLARGRDHAASCSPAADGDVRRRRRATRDRAGEPRRASARPGGGIGRARRSSVDDRAGAYARLVRRVEHRPAVVLRDGQVRRPARCPAPPRASCPTRATSRSASTTYRVATFTAPDFNGGTVRVAVAVRTSPPPSSGESNGRSLVVRVLGGFLVLAFAFALTVSRSLQSQIQRLLDAARRLGSGRLLDRGADRGQRRVRRARQRVQLDGAPARGAAGGAPARARAPAGGDPARRRVVRRGPRPRRRCSRSSCRPRSTASAPTAAARRCAAGPAAACRGGRRAGDARRPSPASSRRRGGGAGRRRAPAETDLGGASALAAAAAAPGERRPRARHDLRRPRRPRRSPPAERELFAYLTSQAAVSVENVDLHETVQRQAVTDELTGLFNHRRFQEVMADEVERARRFGHEMGLIMLDIDNFKRVNDTYGHLQGDMVLREVARVLRESSREIDEPARYGGEEMAVALPQTDLDGRVPVRRARAAARSRRSSCRCWTATARCASPPPSAPPSLRRHRRRDKDAPGRRGRRRAVPGEALGQEPHVRAVTSRRVTAVTGRVA